MICKRTSHASLFELQASAASIECRLLGMSSERVLRPAGKCGALLALLLVASVQLVSGQQWSGFVNTLGSLLDFSCPNNTVITGIASDFR